MSDFHSLHVHKETKRRFTALARGLDISYTATLEYLLSLAVVDGEDPLMAGNRIAKQKMMDDHLREQRVKAEQYS